MNTEMPPAGSKRNWQEELSATGDELVGRVRELVKEGTVRRIIIKHEGRTLLEVPLTIGVVGALLAPQIAALGALAALVSRCSIMIDRESDDGPGAPSNSAELPPGSTTDSTSESLNETPPPI